MCQQTSARPLPDPSGPRKVALGDSQERSRAPSGPPSDPPEELPGAAKPRICKRLQREHHFRPPSQSTLYRWWHPAPPVVNTIF